MRSLSAAAFLLASSLSHAQSAAPRGLGESLAGQGIQLPAQRDLAGKPIGRFPHFQTTRTFNAGEPVYLAFDPRTDTGLANHKVNVYVIEHAALPQFLAGKKL